MHTWEKDKLKINELSIQLVKLKREYRMKSKKVQEGIERDAQKLGKYKKKKGETNNKKYNEEDNRLKLSRENNRIKNNLKQVAKMDRFQEKCKLLNLTQEQTKFYLFYNQYGS